MIRQFRQRWKCGKGSSLFAKFARNRRTDDSGAASPEPRRRDVLSPPENRCDLVTNGWKVSSRQGVSRPEKTAFAAAAADYAPIGGPWKLFINQWLTRISAKVRAARLVAISRRDE
jgi:hypothetical protein